MKKIFSKPKKVTIGIPRAMLYYRYKVLWTEFFKKLGINYIVSGDTNKLIVDEGSKVSIDEVCLSTKIYMGHISSLIGKCDYILVPRISNFGIRRYMCTKFEAAYDIAVNTFRSTGQKFIAYNIDNIKKEDEGKAFISFGSQLGFSKIESSKAYKYAKKAESEYWKLKLKKQEALFAKDGFKILIAAHSYIIGDAYLGKPIYEYLKSMGAIPIRADITDRKDALKLSNKVSPTLKWELSREIVGSLRKNKEKADGIILISAFPCGPDSMVNEMIIRKFNDIPILNIVLDNQNGTAGIETRLESFIDILKFRGGTL